MAQASEPRIASSVGTPSSWRRSRVGDHVFKGVSVAMGMGLIGLLALMLWELSVGGSRAFATFGIHFITGRNWNPVFGRVQFGALPHRNDRESTADRYAVPGNEVLPGN